MPSSTLYTLHHRHLVVRWRDEMPRRAVETILEYHGLQPAPAAKPDWTFQSGPCVLPPDATYVASHASSLEMWQADDVFFIRHGGGVLCVHPERGEISGALPPSADGISEELYVAVTLALLLLLEADGYFAVHAACLVSPEGRGVLLIGPSDSGKSTMALHLVAQGWHYLTDDSVLLFEEADEVRALPLRRDFCVDPEAEALFPVLRDNPDRMLTDAEKWRVRVDALFPAQRRESCRADALLFPQIAPDRPHSHALPMRPVEALTALLPQASLLRRDEANARTFTRLMGRLVAQAPAHRFLSGADVHHDGARLAALLHPLTSSTHAHTEA